MPRRKHIPPLDHVDHHLYQVYKYICGLFNGSCYVTREHLAAMLGVKKDTITHGTKTLEKAGLIAIERKRVGKPIYPRNVVTLTQKSAEKYAEILAQRLGSALSLKKPGLQEPTQSSTTVRERVCSEALTLEGVEDWDAKNQPSSIGGGT